MWMNEMSEIWNLDWKELMVKSFGPPKRKFRVEVKVKVFIRPGQYYSYITEKTTNSLLHLNERFI